MKDKVIEGIGPAQLYRVQKSDIDKCAYILAEAFEGDPLMAHFLGSSTYNSRKIMSMYKVTLMSILNLGYIYATSKELEGISVWLPENEIKVPTIHFIKNGGLGLVRKIRPGVLKVLLEYENYSVKLHNKHIKEPHWYFLALAVQKKHQGKGYSSKLVKPFFSAFDKYGLSCYLETHTKDNLVIHGHFKFELVETGKVPKTNINHYAMLRKPGGLGELTFSQKSSTSMSEDALA